MKFHEISWNFMNFHKSSWALPRPKNVCSNSLRWWCFLVKSSYPCTRICQEIRWFQQAFEMPKFENFENFKRSFQIMKKNFQTRVFLEKSHFSEAQNALMFFGQILVPLYEDLPGDPVIPASIRNAKIWKFWKLQKKFSNYEKKLSKSRFFRKIAFFRSPKCITIEDI